MSQAEMEAVQSSDSERERNKMKKIRQFFETDKSQQSGRFLAKQKRKLIAAIEEMRKEQQEIKYIFSNSSMKNDFTINAITNYSFKIMNLPVDDKDQLLQIYNSSNLHKQSFANGKKCAAPKLTFLSEFQEDQMIPKCYRFEGEANVQIEIENGARLIYTTDGKFPQEGWKDSKIIYESHSQMTFAKKCVLRIKAQKEGMLDSNCQSFELRPNLRSGDDRKMIREYLVQKSDARFDLSNSIEQSEINFPL